MNPPDEHPVGSFAVFLALSDGPGEAIFTSAA